MTRHRFLFFSLSAFVVLLIIGGGWVGAARNDDGEDSLYKHLSIFTEVLGLVRRAYVDEVDLQELMAGAMDATTEALDPFSVYLPPGRGEAFAETREKGLRQTGMTVVKDRGIAFVAAVEPGSPAAESGVEASDILAKIEGRSTRLMPVWRLHEILAAAPGTEVGLEVIRRGERESVSLTLAVYAPPQAAIEKVEEIPVLKVGGLRPEGFATVMADIVDLAKSGEERMLVDLRGVATGDPQVAYDIAALLSRGDLGFLDQRGERVRTFSAAEPRWQGAVVVLVDRATLGPAEILASVLRQAAGAELVGERTFGYAGKRELAPLSSGASLMVTKAFYTGPDGEPIRDSLEPEVRVTDASRKLDEKDLSLRDLILRRGLSHLKDLSAPEEREAA